MFAAYKKAIYPALVALVGVLGTYLANGELDRVSLAIAVVGALQVTASFFVTNVPGYEFAKAVVGALAGGIIALQDLIADGTWEQSTTAAVVTAVVLSVLTYAIPNGDGTNDLGSFPTEVANGNPNAPLGMQDH